MIITDKMIKELQRRIDVSYEEAERYLKRAGGNIDLAESYAKKRRGTFLNRLLIEVEKLLNASLIYHFRVTRKKHTLMDIPIFTIFILFFIIGDQSFFRLSVVFIVGALISECHMELHRRENEEPYQLYRTVKKTKDEPKTQEVVYYDLEEDDTSVEEAVEEELKTSPENEKQSSQTPCDEPIEESQDLEEEEFYEVTIDK